MLPLTFSIVELTKYRKVWKNLVHNLKIQVFIELIYGDWIDLIKIDRLKRTFANVSRTHNILPKHSSATIFCEAIKIIDSFCSISIGNKCQLNWSIALLISLNSLVLRWPSSHVANKTQSEEIASNTEITSRKLFSSWFDCNLKINNKIWEWEWCVMFRVVRRPTIFFQNRSLNSQQFIWIAWKLNSYNILE